MASSIPNDSVIQTAVAMLRLWRERNPASSHDRYLQATSTDLLTHMGLKPTVRRAFRQEVLLALVDDLWVLYNTCVTTVNPRGNSFKMWWPVFIEGMSIKMDGQGGVVSVSLRYHPGHEMYDCLGEDDTIVSTKLLEFYKQSRDVPNWFPG
jgi:hypothetical protein